MSNDLISRQDLIWEIGNAETKYVPVWWVCETINKMPTAYDVDKVVERIKDIMDNESIRYCGQAVQASINIVKAGGME